MAERPHQEPSTGEPDSEEVPPPQDVTEPETLSLAAALPAADRDQWRGLVAAVLRKSGHRGLPDPVEAALDTELASGVQVSPLYGADEVDNLPSAVGVPGLPPFVRGSRAAHDLVTGWDVRARHADPDVSRTREAIAADLDNGVTSLWLVLGPGATAVGAIPDVLADVLLDIAPVVLQAGPATAQAAEVFFELAATGGYEPVALSGNLGADPFGDAIRAGSDPDLSAALELARRCREDFPGMRAIVVDGTVLHEAGASVVEELGTSLAAGLGYLRALTEHGLDLDAAFDAVDFRYSAGADQFLTIAALRAARRLWNRVGEVSGASTGVRAQRQHAVTSPVMMTRRDPWVNMLRTTVACFSAGVGGADAVTVAPFDSELGLPDAFARRIARNTQTLLMEEGHLARVLDPAGGSWYVESLTEQVAAAAWDWFTEIERTGGLAAAMADGFLAERIASVWAIRRERLGHRTEPIIGVSEFPNLTETLPVREPYPAAEPGPAASGRPAVRAAADFETLRARVDAAAERGSRPAVFLATLGPIAASTPRASFAANLFQVAGLQTPGNEADDDDDAAIVTAFTGSGTTVACLCGTNAAYAERASDLTEALGNAGASQLWITGPPSATGELAGVDGHVFAGCDALAVLGRTLDALGVDGAEDKGGEQS